MSSPGSQAKGMHSGGHFGGNSTAGSDKGGLINGPGIAAKFRNKLAGLGFQRNKQVTDAKAAAPGSTTPMGDTSPHYSGFPADRVWQATQIGVDVVTGSIFGVAKDIMMGQMGDDSMTQPDGRTFNKNRDNQGATRGTNVLDFNAGKPYNDMSYHSFFANASLDRYYATPKETGMDFDDIASDFFVFPQTGF